MSSWARVRGDNVQTLSQFQRDTRAAFFERKMNDAIQPLRSDLVVSLRCCINRPQYSRMFSERAAKICCFWQCPGAKRAIIWKSIYAEAEFDSLTSVFESPSLRKELIDAPYWIHFHGSFSSTQRIAEPLRRLP
jgi:hypothetical protein